MQGAQRIPQLKLDAEISTIFAAGHIPFTALDRIPLLHTTDDSRVSSSQDEACDWLDRQLLRKMSKELLALGWSAGFEPGFDFVYRSLPSTSVNLLDLHSLTASDLIAQRSGSPRDLAAAFASSPFRLLLPRCAAAPHPCTPPLTLARIDLEDRGECVAPPPVYKHCRRMSSWQPGDGKSVHKRLFGALTL